MICVENMSLHNEIPENDIEILPSDTDFNEDVEVESHASFDDSVLSESDEGKYDFNKVELEDIGSIEENVTDAENCEDDESFISDEVWDQFNKIDSEDIDSNKENVIDKIIDAFIVKRRKALIDQEDYEEDIIDYEASVQRLFGLAIGLALTLALMGTALLGLLVNQWSGRSIVVLEPNIPQVSPKQMYPHVALVFNDGNIEIFEMTGNSRLNHSWSLRVPKQQYKNSSAQLSVSQYFGYLSFISNNQMMVFYPNGNKEITAHFNDGYTSNLKHITIKNSKVPQKHLYDPRFVQIGPFFWIFGGLPTEILCQHFLFESCDIQYIQDKMTRQTLLWNKERQIYIEGPELPLPSKILGRGCTISLNRSHVMILYMDIETKCVNAWLYSFEEFKWNYVKHCIYKPPVDNLDQFTLNLMCASYLDKNGNRHILAILDDFVDYIQHTLDTFIWTDYEYNNHATISEWSDECHVFLVNVTSLIGSQISNSFNSLNFSKAMSVFESQGKVFILTSDVTGPTETLDLYGFVENEMVYLQNVTLKQPFEANSIFTINDAPSGHDYIAVTGQLNRKLK